MPFFSVITSTYNAAATLPRLLDSLSAQTCRDFNWIVQDGASTDATMEIVEHYRPRLPAVLEKNKKDKENTPTNSGSLKRKADDKANEDSNETVESKKLVSSSYVVDPYQIENRYFQNLKYQFHLVDSILIVS